MRNASDVSSLIRPSGHSRLKAHKNCILIGNGPSLPSHIDYIKDAISDGSATAFACNSYATYDYPGLPTPSYYVLGDPLFQSDDYIDNLAAFFCAIVRRYPGVTLATSELIAKHIYSKISVFPDIFCRIIYAPFGPHLEPGKYAFNLQRNIEPYQNVVVLMIQYAVFLGFKRIELFGFDLSMSYSYPPKAGDYFAEQTLSYKWKHKPDESCGPALRHRQSILRAQICSVLDCARELNIEIRWE